MTEKKEAIIVERKIVHFRRHGGQRGTSYAVILPKKWIDNLGLTEKELKKTKLLVIADEDVRIVNPRHKEEVRAQLQGVVERFVSEAKITRG